MGKDKRDAGEERGGGLNGAQRLNGLNYLNELILFRERQLPTVAVRIEDVDGVIYAVSVRADLLDVGADILQRLDGFLFLLPRNVQRVVRVCGSWPFGRVEQMNLEVAQPDIDFLNLAGFELFFGRFDALHDLPADDFGIEFHGFV